MEMRVIGLVIYGLLSGVCITIATTGLLTKLLSVKQEIVLILYVSIATLTINMFAGVISGVVVIPILLIIIILMEKEHYILNIFLACLGYLLNVGCNEGLLFVLNVFFDLSVKVIMKDYANEFSAVYAVFLLIIMYGLRKLLYDRLKIQNVFFEFPKATQYGLAINLGVYCVLFIVNLALGQQAGYDREALKMNSILFGVSLVVSSLVIFQCIRGVRSEEQKRAELKQKEILEYYVDSLEEMVKEMQSFRHDYKNILSSMSGYIRENKMEELKQYFDEKIKNFSSDTEVQMEAWKCLKNIQPMELKGFLYEKMLLAFARGVKMQVYVMDGMKIQCTYMEELIRILGILIDNAIEASEQLPSGYVAIEIAKTDQAISFSVKNNYLQEPDFMKMGKEQYTTKGKERGNGLCWVEETIEKHKEMFHELKIEKNEVIQRIEIMKDSF